MSSDMVYEDVPRISKRSGDFCIAGSNNASIILGRDRRGNVDSGYGSINDSGQGRNAGAIHLTTGRSSENPSVRDDRASIYISSKTDPDIEVETESIGSKRQAVSGISFRADCIRVSSRLDFKVSIGKAYLVMDSSGRIVIEGDISLGQDAAERIIRGDSFSKFWNTVIVSTPAGPSGPLPPIPESVFSPRNKVK